MASLAHTLIAMVNVRRAMTGQCPFTCHVVAASCARLASGRRNAGRPSQQIHGTGATLQAPRRKGKYRCRVVSFKVMSFGGNNAFREARRDAKRIGACAVVLMNRENTASPYRYRYEWGGGCEGCGRLFTCQRCILPALGRPASAIDQRRAAVLFFSTVQGEISRI